MEVLLSIIVPCYNVSPYIDDSFKSLISQKDIKNFEILFIDDCSTDDTSLIIQQLISQTNAPHIHFQLIKNSINGGYGKAVNLGINKANGKYICIFEPDDILPSKYYSILLQQIQKNSLQACFYDTYIETRNGIKNNVVNLYNPYYAKNTLDILTEQEIQDRLALGNCGICLGIYLRDFLMTQNIKLNENSKGYEDIAFIALLFSQIKKVKIIPGGGYRYRRDNISQSVLNYSNFHKILIVTKYVLEQVQKNQRYAAILGFLLTHLKTYHDKAMLSKQNFLVSNIKEIAREIIENAELKCNHRVLRFIKSLQKEFNLKNISAEVVDNYYPIHYAKTLPLSDYLKEDFSILYSYAHLKFYLATNEMSVFDSNINDIQNDILTFSNIPESEKDLEFIDFIQYFLLHTPYSVLSKNSIINNDIFLLARQMNIIPSVTPYIHQANFSLFLGVEKFEEMSDFNDFAIIKAYYALLESHTKSFVKYLRRKSIAIVGNSPCELGKNKGMEIDSHDVVIRFNNFSIDEKYINDYGKKTNVWALTPALNSIMERENISFDFVLCAHTNRKTPMNRFNILKNWIFSGANVAQIPCIDILIKYDIRVMSMGLIVALWILENIDFKKMNLYGFSLKEQERGVTHYFEGDPSKGKILPIHKWDQESQILASIKQVLKEKYA